MTRFRAIAILHVEVQVEDAHAALLISMPMADAIAEEIGA